MSFKDNQPNPEAENMPMQYARYYMPTYSAVPTSILNYIIVSYAISFLQFGRSFLDRMRLFYVTFKMFLNNLTHYKFNKVEPKKRIGRKKTIFYCYLDPSPTRIQNLNEGPAP